MAQLLSDVLDLPIKVDVSSLTEEERKELQLRLFEFGVRWSAGQSTPLYLWAHYYFIDSGSRLTIKDYDLNYFNWCPEKQISVTKLKEVLGMTQKTFTKDDLKDGMVVKYRGGCDLSDQHNGLSLVVGNSFVSLTGFNYIKDYTDDLKACDYSEFDIIEVFEVISSCALKNMHSQWELKSIWKREEKSPEQIEIEKIQAEMDVLNKRLGELKGKV